MKKFELGPPMKTEERRCAHCCQLNNGAFQAGPEIDSSQPGPGDLCICSNCGEFSIVTEDNKLRRPTEAEILEIGPDPTARAVRDLWVRARKKATMTREQPK